MPEPRLPPQEPPSGTSSSLLERIKAHDQAAWERLVRLFSPLVYRWCRRAGLQAADAADVGQEVFRAVARKVGDFRRERAGDSFRAWLRTITVNKVRDDARRRQRGPEAAGGSDARRRLQQVPSAEPGAGEEAAEVRLLCHRARELIRGEFAERHWEAFWRVAVEGQYPADVAKDLGMTLNAVYLAKSRVLGRLRREFDGLVDGAGLEG